MLVDPSDKVQSSYDFLVSVEEHILSKLKDGAALKDVYDSAVNKVKKERPELADKLTKNFGFSMGIEFRYVQFLPIDVQGVPAPNGPTFCIHQSRPYISHMSLQNIVQEEFGHPVHQLCKLPLY